MHLNICHTLKLTAMPAAEPQNLRLVPFLHKALRVEKWQIMLDGRTDWPLFQDGFGNQVLSLTQRQTQHLTQETLTLLLTGRIETFESYGLVQEGLETLPPVFYAGSTPLTRSDAALEALAYGVSARLSKPIEKLHALMLGVRTELKPDPHANPQPMQEAAQALALGVGSVRDAAHIFIACAKILGFPARFVSGFLWLDETSTTPSLHAWAEVYVVDLGWVGFDPSFGLCPTELYVRTCIGRDGLEAAPIRMHLDARTQEALASMHAYHHPLQSQQQ